MPMMVTYTQSVTPTDAHKALGIQSFYWGLVTKTWRPLMWVTLASSPLEVAKTPTINHIEVQTIWHGPRPQVNREALMQQATPRAWLSPLRAEGRDQTPLGRQFILHSSPLLGV